MKSLWAWPYSAKQWHIRTGPNADSPYTSGPSLCGKDYHYWYPPRPDVQDDDARCCPKCRAELRRMEGVGV